MILVDSSVWIAYFNGAGTREVDMLNELLGREPIVIGDVVLAEVLQGFKKNADFNKAHELLLAFPVVNVLGREVAIESAKNFRLLRKKGKTVRKTIDSIIATFCIRNGLSLLHADRDFDPFAELLGLDVV